MSDLFGTIGRRTAAGRGLAARISLLLVLAGAVSAQERVLEPLPSLAPLIERVSPAVVNISVNGRIATNSPLAEDPLFRRFFDVPQEREFASAGSGVIVDARQGYLVTNHHVVENAEEITITLLDSRVMEATVIGSDPASDVAVLKIEANDLVEMAFAKPGSLAVGDYVVAIGNPFGFSNTVTSGIVSALGRSGLNREAYEDFIQTDASINPGNSGGPLVNLNGELVGINSAIISRTGQNIGIGFAIPVTTVRNVVEQLIENGEVSRGLLGVSIISITPDLARQYALSSVAGALVTEVLADSAAEEAGLEVHDVIVAINDQPIKDSGSLKNSIGLLRPGVRVRVGFIRDGSERTVTAMLNALTANTATSPDVVVPERNSIFEGAELVPGRAADGTEGLRVARVDSDSLAAERGLTVGDVITEINRQRVRSLAEARQLVAEARSVVLYVYRGNRTLLVIMR